MKLGAMDGLSRTKGVADSEAELVRLSSEQSGGSFVTRSGCAALGDGRLYVAAGRQGRLRVDGLLRENDEKLREAREKLETLASRRSELGSGIERLRVGLAQSSETLAEAERTKSSLDATMEMMGSNESDTPMPKRATTCRTMNICATSDSVLVATLIFEKNWVLSLGLAIDCSTRSAANIYSAVPRRLAMTDDIAMPAK